MVLVHLTSSRFFGGPERQLLGLAHTLAPARRTLLLSFPEDGHSQAFVDEAARQGVDALALAADTPHLLAARRELEGVLRRQRADLLCCHAYKASMLGLWAARRVGIPVVSVSRGWTAESPRVRLYEAAERLVLRWMDRVVCVSEGQAAKVRRAGVPAERIRVIANAVDTRRFAESDPACRAQLQGLFLTPRRFIVGAAGRLSPEKGFDVLVNAAARLVGRYPDVGFVVCGDGPLRPALAQRIASLGLQAQVVLAGFRADLDRLVPCFDVAVLSSFTEGMPNVVLEAMAAGVPVVATAVGGTPELVDDGVSGHLVPSGDAERLAQRIGGLLDDERQRCRMGQHGRERVRTHFTFEAQARKYQELFAEFGRAAARRRGAQRLLAWQRTG